ncbi:MAG: adenosine deaminase [Armatimonadetes bacterium]|nr:adenosine deaminase [Armatimonadota bacterium]
MELIPAGSQYRTPVFERELSPPLEAQESYFVVTPEEERAFQAIVHDDKKLKDLISLLPKAELHNHLEGAVRPSTVLEIAKRDGIPIPESTVEEVAKATSMQPGDDLLVFLQKIRTYAFVFDKKEDISRVTYETVEDAARQNVKYLELRFNPLKQKEKYVTVEEFIESALAGARKAEEDLGVKTRLIVSINRSYPVEAAWRVARAAIKYEDEGVVGMDLAADEINYPPELFADVFKFARENGVHVTIHAGEAAGPESVRKAIELCGAERIGHGVRSQEDPSLEAILAERKIPLELCPTSNLQTGAVPSLGSYPLKHYLNLGIPVTLNTDDSQIFLTTLNDEYAKMARSGLSLSELLQVDAHGLNVAFLPESEKRELRPEFLQGFRNVLQAVHHYGLKPLNP